MQFDFTKIPHDQAYKLCVAAIVPRPVAWVVSQDREGRVNAAPYSFFNVFSDNPVVVGIGCSRRPQGSPKDTLANIEATGQFVVNLVSAPTAEQMNITAIDFPPGVNEIEEAGLTTAPSSKVRVPRIAESPVALECEVFQFVPTLGHTIVLGKVVAMEVRDDCVLDAAKYYLDTPKLDLVGRMHGRGWYARTTDRIEIHRIPLADWEARMK
ncbi:flavin reductase family protein [Roseomonas sp. JC162]|uniref:Flavin reductase family protein n=1 Tax=Neoroseomonas marina TaxID=1232220 RepID=A0A848EJL5_9PROT|nr:flavin reductase family protein [Neoroseomonas marina]NMJ43587.1 flavin reductase family protein [Neoroseomonas marina]